MEQECEKKEKIEGEDRNLRLIGQMISSISDKGRSSSKQHLLVGKLFGSYSFINISEGIDEVEDVVHGSRRNMVEVAVLMNILQRLVKEQQCHGQKLCVCVICPYAAQIMEIERRVKKRFDKLSKFEVKVKSVEGFQGRQADVVIVSTVKSNSVGEFSSYFPQANYAMIKARHCVWILGDAKSLGKADSVWENIVFDAKERDCFSNAGEDVEISQVIIDVKSKLDDLDDLLDKKSIIFEDTRWKVTFSENFVKSFSKLPSNYSKKLVLNFLLKLANGWRPKNKKTDVLCESSVKIARQYKVEGRYIICTNDLSMIRGYATQILKVWDILHLHDVPTLVKKLDKIYGAYDETFLSRCKQKCKDGYLEVPGCYNSLNVFGYSGINNDGLARFFKANTDGKEFVEDEKVNESLLLMKFYSLSAGVLSQLMSASDGTVLNVPFEVSDEEREVILNERSTFILGRSGTGKTTVLVMKLFQKEQQLHMASEGFNVHFDLTSGSSCYNPHRNQTSIRQLFVTVNPKLCFAVKEHINNLRRFVHDDNFDAGCIFSDGNDMDEYEKFKNIPDSFEEIPSHVYPIVITFNMFLLMLDRTIGSSYFDRFPDIRKIYSMGTPSSGLIARTVRKKEVTYNKFRTSYWPHFNSQLTRKLDPSRVFTEINSCIKGQLHLGENNTTNCSLQGYQQLSNSRVSNFSEDEREIIYKIFEDYEKKKIVRGEFDLSDLVNDLHKRLKCIKYEGEFMDFVYIDEVQDLTMKQLALFKYICKNVEEGYVFAGDTAQTIARGVSFRFEDMKCLFYKEFLNGVEDKGIVSPIFHLSRNFRTHSGVVNLAQSVIELIYYFFPNSIDTLKPETSLLCGELPVLLDCGSHEDAIIKIFQDKGIPGEKRIIFGAQQVIMVRDDDSRDKIAGNIGRHALVLTIFECKGLEFEDVLLYNFFGSSPLKEQWRVIYECMEKRLGLLSAETYPSFTDARHNVLCYELKQLYVAITRTKQRLWICEDSDGVSSPIAEYWQKLNLVQVEKLDNTFAQKMQAASSSEDWKLRGLKMLEVHNYSAAIQCFEQASEFDLKEFAKASKLRESAHSLQGLRLEKSSAMLREAAGLFESIKEKKKAAGCLFDAGDYERAGEIYLGESDLQRAGECFISAGNFERAAEVYAKGHYFYECLYACSEGELFDLGLRYVRGWKEEENLSKPTKAGVDLIASEQKFLGMCALASHKQLDKDSMMKYVKDFSCLESMRNFLKELGCFHELIELELEYGNHLEASEFARQKRDIHLEADILVNAGYFADVSQLYLAYVLASSLWADGGKGWPLKEFPSKKDLLFKAKAHAHKCSPDFYEKVCANIQYLSGEELDLLELKNLLPLAVKHKDLLGEILLGRSILDRLLAHDVSMYELGNDEMRENSVKRISLKVLFHHWNFWKRKIETIFNLESSKVQATRACADCMDFCLKYFGVRKQRIGQGANYSLIYPNAKWVKKYMPANSVKMESISVEQLITAAKGFWCSEILDVGIKLLELLKSFRSLAVQKSLPEYHICEILSYILEATDFLLKTCSILQQTEVSPSLNRYFNDSADEFLLLVFSLSCINMKMLQSKNLSLQSEASRNIVKKSILQRFKAKIVDTTGASPTHLQDIQVAVILLGSSWKTNRRYHEIGRRISNDFPWNALIRSLLRDATLQDSYGTMRLVQNLFNALSESYNSRSKISPPCFVYLLDRLLVLVSCFNGCLFATRSSVSEWLVHLNWNASKEASGFYYDGSLISAGPIYDFLASTIHELLINKQGTEEWILKAGFDLEIFFPSLALKLLVLMCFVCLNSKEYLELLNDVLNRSSILPFLPSCFMEVLSGRDGSTFVNVLAEALQKIDDPMVIIRNDEVCPILHARHAVFLNVFNRSRDAILDKLFPSHWKN